MPCAGSESSPRDCISVMRTAAFADWQARRALRARQLTARPSACRGVDFGGDPFVMRERGSRSELSVAPGPPASAARACQKLGDDA